ncbi:MAG: hypothetical protein CL602_01560 [Alteromonas sp.]|uniref:Type-F conjugative transfer system pilin assembly protein TrbC n=1 Tax=Alteromonas australica TaxID=589873 RepID=A0A358DYX4_9ALTE|nr:type-F conjugative transfer system pilin assembly protein TrbC [Alteromonas australica]MBU32582.1 hypothetical protein [Alteromonas sp.]HBU51479.1 hypothetical protein [Alteromonas australica]
MVSRISLLLITMLMTALAGAQTIDDDLKKRIDALNKKDGKAQTQLVNNALDRVKEADLETVKTILASDDYKNRLSAYHQTARTVLGLEQETTTAALPAEETNDIGDRLVLFVSSSMPLHVLRNYVSDVDRVGGVMIFRGTIGGIDSFMPTVEFLRKLLAVDPSCTAASCDMRMTNVSIDPQRFTHHGINRVPALIYEKDMKIQAYCKQGDSGPRAQTIAYGDASLAGLTNAIYQTNKEPALKSLLNTLRGI